MELPEGKRDQGVDGEQWPVVEEYWYFSGFVLHYRRNVLLKHLYKQMLS